MTLRAAVIENYTTDQSKQCCGIKTLIYTTLSPSILEQLLLQAKRKIS